MHYTSNIECFEDFVEFTQDSLCTWIVYPPGCAGDLVASIINFHYARTGGRFFGITDSGQVIFRDSDKKEFNKTLTVNQDFINTTNQKLGEENLNLSLLDNIIFSNHGWKDHIVKQIVDFFPNAKVIRILPQNNVEQSIVAWLSRYKNRNNAADFVLSKNFTLCSSFVHPRVLDLGFGKLFDETTFDQLYTSIINHLDLEYKLIRFDFIKFWLSKQHPVIQSKLKQLNS